MKIPSLPINSPYLLLRKQKFGLLGRDITDLHSNQQIIFLISNEDLWGNQEDP
jgi:hypothetical protein